MSSADLLPLIARVTVSLVVVLGLIYVLQRAARRRSGGRAVDATRFTVVARQSLSRSAGVTVLRVGDEALVVGVTDAAVQLLARMPLDSISGTTTDAAATAGAAGTAQVAEVVNLREVRTEVPAAFTPAGAPRRAVATVAAGAQPRTGLSGSALSPATWTSALEVLRERTTRR